MTKAECEIFLSKSNYWNEIAQRGGAYEVQVAELSDAFKILGAERMLSIIEEHARDSLTKFYRVTDAFPKGDMELKTPKSLGTAVL